MHPIHQIIQTSLENQGYTITPYNNPPNEQIDQLSLTIPHPTKPHWSTNIGHIWLNQHPKPLQLYITTNTNGYKTAGLELSQSDPELIKKITEFYAKPKTPSVS